MNTICTQQELADLKELVRSTELDGEESYFFNETLPGRSICILRGLGGRQRSLADQMAVAYWVRTRGSSATYELEGSVVIVFSNWSK